jgi:hypothetical protein
MGKLVYIHHCSRSVGVCSKIQDGFPSKLVLADFTKYFQVSLFVVRVGHV